MYLGKLDGKECSVSPDAPNGSVCITGISGMGKTARLQQIELASTLEGDFVLVLDMNQTHAEGQIFPPIKEGYMKKVSRIHAIKDGLGLGLLQAIHTPQGEEEPFVNLVNAAVQTLSSSQNMGMRQASVLRKAVIYSIGHLDDFQTEAEAISSALLQQKDSYGEAVYQKLWTTLNCGALKPSAKCLQEGKINILDFSGTDATTQVCLAEVVLSNFWRKAQFHGAQKGHGRQIIVLDEFQNLPMGEGAVLKNMLREGRKFGISLLLATQTLEVFPKDVLALLNQAATRLYFRSAQSEARKVAKAIDFENVNKWAKLLPALKVGESIAVGDLSIGGIKIGRPLIIR